MILNVHLLLPPLIDYFYSFFKQLLHSSLSSSACFGLRCLRWEVYFPSTSCRCCWNMFLVFKFHQQVLVFRHLHHFFYHSEHFKTLPFYFLSCHFIQDLWQVLCLLIWTFQHFQLNCGLFPTPPKKNTLKNWIFY